MAPILLLLLLLDVSSCCLRRRPGRPVGLLPLGLGYPGGAVSIPPSGRESPRRGRGGTVFSLLRNMWRVVLARVRRLTVVTAPLDRQRGTTGLFTPSGSRWY